MIFSQFSPNFFILPQVFQLQIEMQKWVNTAVLLHKLTQSKLTRVKTESSVNRVLVNYATVTYPAAIQVPHVEQYGHGYGQYAGPQVGCGQEGQASLVPPATVGQWAPAAP